MKKPKAIPRKPAKYPKIVYINLNILIANLRELSGIANAEIPVKATIIINIGLTIFAETAASPNINPPSIDIAPDFDGFYIVLLLLKEKYKKN